MASRRSLLALPLLIVAASHCGNAFEPASSITSLRVLAVSLDHPYVKPGESVRLDMLHYDGSKRAFDAQGHRIRQVQTLWLGGCFNPSGDLYFSCFPQLARVFAGLGQAAATNTLPPADVIKLIGQGESFTLDIPSDLITRRPAAEAAAERAQGNAVYGLAYVFFAVCGGTLKSVPAEQSTNGLPLGCFDTTTGEALGSDDFVIGYTPIYAYDDFTNTNPVIDGILFEGKPGMTRACSSDAACAQGERCGSLGLCIPVVPHCTERKAADCTTYTLKPVVSRSVVEKDLTAPPVNGTPPDEIIWASFYASDGIVGGERSNDTILINDAVKGWVLDGVKPTEWLPPSGAAGESRIWIVAHDNRGGTSWTRQDVFVE